MSSKQNDTKIHLGNYEEFFILFMDNELNKEQRQMVEDFLAAHPDLRGELELLMSTRLPVEEFDINKEELLSENMKVNSVDEDLLLFIDNELTDEKKKIIALELATNADYKLQLTGLMKTKLDADEIISYPNKAELYRRTERVFMLRTWMRVAAILLVLATFGVFYFSRNSTKHTDAIAAGNNAAVQKKNEISIPVNHANDAQPMIVTTSAPKQKSANEEKIIPTKEKKETIIRHHENTPSANDDLVALNEPSEKITERKTTDPIDARLVTGSVIGSIVAENISKDSFNNPIVTSTDSHPYIKEKATVRKPGDGEADVASNDRKGSVKGFLRKASRLIEKRTGIDPVNDNGELLIGAVAVKLK
jgi:hypothetical protein